jgi:hypothetical protein
MTTNRKPQFLEGCAVLPPMESVENKARQRPGKASNPKGRRGERFALLNAFVDFTLAGLSRAEIAVWLVLYRDTRDGTARTAMTDMARRAGCARRNVARALRRLESVRLVKIVHRGGLRRGSSRYRVLPLIKDL